MDNFLHEYNLAQQGQEEIKTKTKNLNKLVEGDRMNCSTWSYIHTWRRTGMLAIHLGRKNHKCISLMPHANINFSWIYKR